MRKFIVLLALLGCQGSQALATTSTSPGPKDICSRACDNGRALKCSDITSQCEATCRSLSSAPLIQFKPAKLEIAASKEEAREAGLACP